MIHTEARESRINLKSLVDPHKKFAYMHLKIFTGGNGGLVPDSKQRKNAGDKFQVPN